MDETDSRLIAVLAEDGRMTNRALAERIDLPEALVAARLKSLIAANIVRVVAQRSIPADRAGTITAIVQLHLSAPDRVNEVAGLLRAMDEFFIVYETARRPEICAYAHVGGVRALNELALNLAERSTAIVQMNVLPFLAVHRMRQNVASLRHPRPPKPDPADVEEALIRQLEFDARQPVSAIARKIGLSQTATRYRLEKLLQDGKLEIKVVTDAQSMGYTIWADIRISLIPGGIRGAIASFSLHPDVISLAHLAGPANLMVFVVARTVEGLDNFVRQHVRTLPGMLDFAVMRVPRVLKYNYNSILK